jgi:MFS transporter, ACS family, glucarate transporter
MTNNILSSVAVQKPTRVRYGVLGLACSLAMLTYLDRVCFGSVAGNIKTEFELDDSQRGLLFTAFALAYALFEIPSGWLGDIFGPRKTLIRIVLWWSLFTALTGLIWPVPGWLPVGFWALVAIRFCFGMGEAGAFPNIARAFYNWFPFVERGSAQGAVWMAGRLMGGLTPLLVNALLITIVAADGTRTVHWRHIFWIFGLLGLVWCLVFWWWFWDRPEQNPAVNSGELAMIQAGKQIGVHSHHTGVPWMRILKSGNLWLLCLAYFCGSYGWYFNITYLPDYLKEVFHIDKAASSAWERTEAGLLTGAPLLFGSVACLAGGLLTDAFIRRTGNRKWGRRLFGIIGKAVCGMCYFASMFTSNVYLFVLAIAMAAFWNDMTMGAAWASCLDIGRKYSGIVSGCMNTVGNLGGAAAGFATGHVLNMYADDRTFAWQINFTTFAGVYFLAVFCWLFFDSTKPVVDED